MVMEDSEMIIWIDKATYKELLTKWRFAPSGDPFFQGDIGGYFYQSMSTKKEKLKDGEHSKISKEIDW